MVSNIQCVANDKVQVAYDYMADMVMIFRAKETGYPQRSYAGIEGLKEKFHELTQGFNEEIDVDFAVSYFKPNYTQTIIQK